MAPPLGRAVIGRRAAARRLRASAEAPSAAPAPLLRRRSTLEPVALDASREIGAGGEARVYALAADASLAAKVYHHPTVERARKVKAMVDDPPRVVHPYAALAWPVDLLVGEGGRFAGFLMPRARGPRLFELYNPVTRRKGAGPCDHAILHRAGAHLAVAFDALHAGGRVVGDVNESNVILGPGGVVTLVDTDSFQVRDPETGDVHRSGVGKAEFTPPELQGRRFGDVDRTPEHDRFGLGVLLFLALMEGTHPFAGRMEERIRRGLFPHHGHAEIRPPRLAPPFAVLDPELRALFVRCFAEGHADPSARPTAAEWRAALSRAAMRLETCAANRRHRFGPHLDACPWCERTGLLHGRDPFPADRYMLPGEEAPAEHRPASKADLGSGSRRPLGWIAGLVSRGARPAVPPAATLDPRPRPRVSPDAEGPWAMCIHPPRAEGVDAAPVLANRGELERMVAGCRPPEGAGAEAWALRILVWVGADGAADPASVRIVGTAPAGDAVGAAIRAATRVRFHPLTRRGKPVEAWAWIDFAFEGP